MPDPPEFVPAPLDARAPLAGAGVWRYLPWLPVDEPVSLGEPTTPLVAHRGVQVKLEGALPTGSFKDRGAAVLVAALRAAGVERVVEDSSGNAGAALAAYCARAGIACAIHAPASAPPAKVAQLRAFGADVVLVDGPRAAATASAERAAAGDVAYASHARSPLYLAGTMTFAFELHEQLGGAPDAVVIPTGGGALMLGAALGFDALRRAGLVDRVPRLVAAQAAACAPLVDAMASGAEAPAPVTPRPSLADGIQIGAPVRGRQILAALRATGGTAVAVSEDAIAGAHRDAARHGLLVERTSAVALAALDALALDGTVVVAATGHGLKTPPSDLRR
jgi:threonine synthase